MIKIFALIAFVALLIAQTSIADTAPTFFATQQHSVRAFINKMVTQHKFNHNDLNILFSDIEFIQKPINTSKNKLKNPKAKPKKPLSWQQYRALFLTPYRINQGIKFWQQYKPQLNLAHQTFGVPPEIILAILGIETNYGKNKGNHPTLETLTKNAFNSDNRTKFYQKELENFLLLARENSFSPKAILGSYAGAMGYAQFISSSYRHYAVDFDNNGNIDLFHSPADAIGSIANYFSKHRWQKNGLIANKLTKTPLIKSLANTKPIRPKTLVKQWLSRDISLPSSLKDKQKSDIIALISADKTEYWMTYHNFYAITRYNHNNFYAMAVYQLSLALKEALKSGEVM